jgi:hypothetical protein
MKISWGTKQTNYWMTVEHPNSHMGVESHHPHLLRSPVESQGGASWLPCQTPPVQHQKRV